MTCTFCFGPFFVCWLLLFYPFLLSPFHLLVTFGFLIISDISWWVTHGICESAKSYARREPYRVDRCVCMHGKVATTCPHVTLCYIGVPWPPANFSFSCPTACCPSKYVRRPAFSNWYTHRSVHVNIDMMAVAAHIYMYSVPNWPSMMVKSWW